EEVHPAVVVVVDKRAAAAGRLEDVLLALDASIDRRRVQAGGGGDVDEVGVEGAPGRRLPGHGFGRMAGNTLGEEPFGRHREDRAEGEPHERAARGSRARTALPHHQNLTSTRLPEYRTVRVVRSGINSTVNVRRAVRFVAPRGGAGSIVSRALRSFHVMRVQAPFPAR